MLDEPESKLKNQDLMYFTIPACVVEYACTVPDDQAPIVCQSAADFVIIDLTDDADSDKKELRTKLVEFDVKILD